MTQPDPNSGAQRSAFSSAQSALARKPLPGPAWLWPGLAALAVAGVAYLVAGTSDGGHASHRAAATPSAEGSAPSAEGAAPPAEGAAPAAEGATPPTTDGPTTTTAALQPAAPGADPASPPAAAADPAAEPAKEEAEPAKANEATEQAVASAAPTKKKARGNRAKRKRATKAE